MSSPETQKINLLFYIKKTVFFFKLQSLEIWNNNLSKEIANFLTFQQFNFHYENQINILKNIILEKTLEILKKYSFDNKIDLILRSNNYILSNDSLNITNVILEKLNNINFDTKFEKFK